MPLTLLNIKSVFFIWSLVWKPKVLAMFLFPKVKKIQSKLTKKERTIRKLFQPLLTEIPSAIWSISLLCYQLYVSLVISLVYFVSRNSYWQSLLVTKKIGLNALVTSMSLIKIWVLLTDFISSIMICQKSSMDYQSIFDQTVTCTLPTEKSSIVNRSIILTFQIYIYI